MVLSWGLDEPEIRNEKNWGQSMVSSIQRILILKLQGSRKKS